MATVLPGWSGSSFYTADLILLKVPVLVKKGQTALWFGIYCYWSGTGSCQSKEGFISACDETQVSLQEAAKEQKQHQGENDVPMGLRCLQERQTHSQLSSAFLEGLDKPTQPPAVQSILPAGSGGATIPLGCRLLSAIGATDDPAVDLSGEICEAAGCCRGMWDQQRWAYSLE